MTKISNFMKLDSIDRKILNELQQFGRKSASHIAEKIKVSVPTITERIKKLQETGVIVGTETLIFSAMWLADFLPNCCSSFNILRSIESSFIKFEIFVT